VKRRIPQAGKSDSFRSMDRSLLRYIWRHSRRDQLIICAVVLASLPFYFASLDLPRRIVNEAIQGRAFEGGQQTAKFLEISFGLPDWLGGQTVNLFGGFELGRLELLFGLSALFLFFVLVNGAFKYWINVSKGALGERMLRRMRFDLFALVLRFTPETIRRVKSSETATIIKDEVEPIGGFIGDAFILPVFLGTQAVTALFFILLQNIWLGLMAGAVVGIQFILIPRLRRELLRLGKQRQVASRQLAGRVAEVLDGIEAVHVHNVHAWERAEIGARLYQLFDIRFRIFKRKFMVKYLNNFLAQLTPFLFYAIGGYFALTGRLDIGQLVAVIGAYRELPPPLKELIDWDQQRLDVQVKYDQVVQHFSSDRLLPLETVTTVSAGDSPLTGPLIVKDLRAVDPHGAPILDGVSLELDLPARIALVTDGGLSASLFARILARRTLEYSGTVKIGDREFGHLSPETLGKRIAYAGVEPVLFPGTIRDNLVYGLRQKPLGRANEPDHIAARRIAEAKWTGNPTDSVDDLWIDYERAGAANEDELDAILLDLLRSIGMGADIYRFGLSGMIDPIKQPELAERIVDARERLRQIFEAGGMEGLVEPFDVDRYNLQATVAENLLFGVPTSRDLMGRSLAEHAGFRQTLERAGLIDELVSLGARIAETMTEIFRGIPPGHPLFEQFSFISADELNEYEAIVRKRARRGHSLSREDTTRLLALPLGYIEPRHRLGLLTESLRDRLVQARGQIRAMLERSGSGDVEFYDPERVCAAAPLKDNLLFGRISHTMANAQVQITEAITAVVDELGLREAVERIGLDHQVGPAGRLLTAHQRASVNLVRCIVKRPDLTVIDGALAPFAENRRREILALLVRKFADRTLIVTVADKEEAVGLETLVLFRDNGAEVVRASIRQTGPDTAHQQKIRAGGVA